MMDPNIQQRIAQQDLEKVRRQVFNDAYIAGVQGFSDTQELGVMNQLRVDMTLNRLHNILDFLEGLGLIEVQRLAAQWTFKVTAMGRSTWEGNLEWPVGVAQRVL